MNYKLLRTTIDMDHCCSHYLASCRYGDVTGHGRGGVSASAVGVTKSHCCSTALYSHCCNTMLCKESHMSLRHPKWKTLVLTGTVRLRGPKFLLPSPRGELSYLAPLGSENISAPYFKQCFFRGGYYPTRLSQTPRLPVPDRNNKYFILYIKFCINNNI